MSDRTKSPLRACGLPVDYHPYCLFVRHRRITPRVVVIRVVGSPRNRYIRSNLCVCIASPACGLVRTNRCADYRSARATGFHDTMTNSCKFARLVFPLAGREISRKMNSVYRRHDAQSLRGREERDGNLRERPREINSTRSFARPSDGLAT